MAADIARYLEAIALRGYSPWTQKSYRLNLGLFARWAEERGLAAAADITKPILERYQRHLYYFRNERGKPLSFQNQASKLTTLKVFFRWLVRDNRLLYNPASEIELPKVPPALPKAVLSAAEAEAILQQPDITTALGLRDRAILETFYSTGIRRMELVHLSLYDLDQSRGALAVREGKGKRSRVVPIGERAMQWIDKYTIEVRPQLVMPPDAGALFLTKDGGPFSGMHLTMLVRGYVRGAGVGKDGACHLFRHTMATLMLEAGADIRFIQALLGHAKLTTTEIYTHVSIKKLKEIHTALHPAHAERIRSTPPSPELDELLAALDDEHEEETTETS